jgi:crossover junction endodeoxyribonuclease RuvC
MAQFLANVKIIGIDPGLQRTGWGVISAQNNRISYIAHGTIAAPNDAPLAHRLGFIFKSLNDVIATHRPDEAAIEETIVANSARTSILLGQARGAAMVALEINSLQVFEYATRLIKKAVVGTGTADKEQIGFMVRRLLPSCGNVGIDAADALAAAIAHSSMRTAPQMRVK